VEHSEAKAQALDSTQRAEALQEQLERTVMSEQALLLKVGLSLVMYRKARCVEILEWYALSDQRDEPAQCPVVGDEDEGRC
jgi:hypothetical protein